MHIFLRIKEYEENLKLYIYQNKYYLLYMSIWVLHRYTLKFIRGSLDLYTKTLTFI